MKRFLAWTSVLLVSVSFCFSQYSGEAGYGGPMSFSSRGFAFPVYSQSTPAPQAWQIPAGSVGYYPFTSITNASGLSDDESSIGTNDLFVSGNMLWQSASNGIRSHYNRNNSFAWSGFMSITNYSTMQFKDKFTAILWLRPQGVPANVCPIGRWGSGTDAKQFVLYRTSEGILQGYLHQSDNAEKLTPTIKDDIYVWQMWTLMADGTNFSLSKNAGTQSSVAYNGTITNNINRPILIGKLRPEDTAGLWDGYISTPIFYTNALSQAQVLDIYTNTYQTHGWSNSLALSNPSLYSNTVLEILGEYNYPADTSYIGTNHMTSYTGANAYDPAWVNYQTGQGAWSFAADDYLIIPSNNLYTSTNTIMCWVNLRLIGQDAVSIWGIRQVSPENQINLRVYNPTASLHYFRFFGYGSGGAQFLINTATNIIPSNWVHVACTWENNQARIYTNGILVGIDTVCAIPESSVVTQAKIGQSEYDSGGDITAYVDDFIAYNKVAASSNNIWQAFNASKHNHTNSTPW